MDLGHQRAGRVDHAELAILGAIPFGGRDAVSAEDDALTLGDLVEALDKNRALFFERFEHEAVVHYLMAHIERTTVRAQCAAHGLDCTINASTKAARLRQDYLLNRHFAQRHPITCNWFLSARSIWS